MEKNYPSDKYENIKKIIAISEQRLFEWFDDIEMSSDIKNLNYAITCLKRIVETIRLMSIEEKSENPNEVTENGNSSENLESLPSSISMLIKEMQDENGTGENPQDKI